MRELFICILFLSVNSITAQVKVPKYSNEFLAIGVGARSMAMGNAGTSSVNDATAVYWNPSVQTHLEKDYNFSLMHNEYFGGIAAFDFLGFSSKIDSSSSIGVGIIRFGIDNIPDTRFLYDASGVIDYNNIQFFSAADYGIIISYARNISSIEGLSFGGNFKVVHRSAGNFASAWGFGLDASATLKREKWKISTMARDVTTTFNAWTHSSTLLADVYNNTGNSIPRSSVELTLPSLVLAASYAFDLVDNWIFTPSLDVIMNFDGQRTSILSSNLLSVNPAFGLEVGYLKRFFLRGGMSSFQYKREVISNKKGLFYQPAFGTGFQLEKFSVDYALTNQLSLEDAFYSHVFSVNIYLDKKE